MKCAGEGNVDLCWQFSPSWRLSIAAAIRNLSVYCGKIMAVHIKPNCMELQNRVWQREESLPEFFEDIERLAWLAYPDVQPEMLEVLTKNQFIDALPDKGSRLWVHQNQPLTLQQALETALELESYQVMSKLCNKVWRHPVIEWNDFSIQKKTLQVGDPVWCYNPQWKNGVSTLTDATIARPLRGDQVRKWPCVSHTAWTTHKTQSCSSNWLWKYSGEHPPTWFLEKSSGPESQIDSKIGEPHQNQILVCEQRNPDGDKTALRRST